MTEEYFRIKDLCRKELTKHLGNIISIIPKADNLRILDIGCGTGVPTFLLAEKFSGTIMAIDIDKPALSYLQNKIDAANYNNKITVRNVSLFDFQAGQNFDIILAEGFLNVVGFEKGFKKIIELLKPGGYFLIHDEHKDHEKKIAFIINNNCSLSDTLYLNETTWWDDYYNKLNNQIKEIKDPELKGHFKRDISEIEFYKTDSSLFRSIYYVVLKQQ